MEENKSIQISRAKVSALIFKVLTRVISVKDALDSFPKDVSDPSLECAWHALVHFEADEDLRAQDIDYANEQDEFLEMIAFILKEGKELPDNIIKGYNQYYGDMILPRKSGLLNTIKSLFRFTS